MRASHRIVKIMLDRSKILAQLVSQLPHRVQQGDRGLACAQAWWHTVVQDPVLSDAISQAAWPFLVPQWNGLLNVWTPITPRPSNYRVVAVDGSQVYPDRHTGVACAMISVGSVDFTYQERSHVQIQTVPHIVFDVGQADDGALSEALINGTRTEYEFAAGVQHMLSGSAPYPELLLLDGSLIFWHLDLQRGLHERFLKKYLGHLETLATHRAIHASYVSLPQSRELVNILRAAANREGEDIAAQLAHITDAQLLATLLPVNTRTTIFCNRAQIVREYPEQLVPHFVYVNVGAEIARVEFPAWMATPEIIDTELLPLLLDQIAKGGGYPISLSEAHEAAVIRGADREFFLRALDTLLERQGARRVYSTKQLRKKIVPI